MEWKKNVNPNSIMFTRIFSLGVEVKRRFFYQPTYIVSKYRQINVSMTDKGIQCFICKDKRHFSKQLDILCK